MSVRRLACIASLAALACAAPRGPAERDPAVPNTPLTTHEGREVRFYDDLVRGKVVLVYFMFTTCEGICPGTTANVARVQDALGDRLGRDVFFYGVTLDPEIDTPAVLREYARDVGAKPGWLFLTGDREDIEDLRTRLGVYDPDPVIDADKTQHAGLLVVGNDNVRRWTAVPGLVKPSLIVDTILRIAG